MTQEKRDPALPPPGHDWTFRSAAAAAGFDAHVREQLPWYELATGALAHFVRHYLPEEGFLIDVGASTGNVAAACADVLRSRRAKITAAEPSAEMRALYRHPEGVPAEDSALLPHSAEEFPWDTLTPGADVVVFFLTLSFVPVRHRDDVIRRAYEKILPGGVLLILDKVSPVGGGYWGQAVRRLTLAGKIAAGVSPADVVAKELSLGGVQRPLRENHLQYAGLSLQKPVHEWFRFGEFVGWAVEK